MPTVVQYKKTPLHYAASSQAGPDVVKALLNAYPNAARIADTVCFMLHVGRVCVTCACRSSKCMFWSFVPLFDFDTNQYIFVGNGQQIR